MELLKITEADLEMIMHWRMLPEVTRYMYTDPILTIEDQKHWLNWINTNPSVRYWILQVEGEKIGVINLYDIDLKNRRCLWGHYIGNVAYRGKGIAKTIECNIYDFVFDVLQFNKVGCEIMAFNENAIALHQKLGSEIEATFKEHICKGGEFYDVVFVGITRSKWQSIKGQYNYEKIFIES
ncbi:MAG TPA: UDP-4-amino-4,6-dideoxy-N-acetyl-beta-L-altrosamine N-acetyltransferase [Bacillota bacterium]|nr:UDP-4-amino-4,6-dideoxy-N-acetyl-beta-L-altrosamine N-acetyltransferase [Bacillota bacterium]